MTPSTLTGEKQLLNERERETKTDRDKTYKRE